MIYTENYFQLWRIIAGNDESEEESEEMPGSWPLPAWLPRCLCDTKEKYFIHLTRGSPCLAADTAWWPQTRLRVAEAPGNYEANTETHGALYIKDLSIFTA